jgi:hypothetical protein
MMHKVLLRRLADSSSPVSTPALTSALGLNADSDSHARVEILAQLSPSIRWQGSGWVLSTDTPARRVLAALRSYSSANSSKRIFRLSAALGALPPQEQPTEEQLRELLSDSSEFKLLPNAMIKRVS